jgi:hypothetical protein
MLGGKSQSSIRPVALGTTVDSSTYGAAIPLIYGLTAGGTQIIWMRNIRQQSSKKAKKGKGTPDYVANVDFLFGHNPIMGVGQGYINQNQWLILNAVKYSHDFGFEPVPTITVPDSLLYMVLAVTVTIPYSQLVSGGGNVVFNDYGAQGSSTLSGDTLFEIPLWNAAYNGPDPVHSSACRNNPFAYWWTPSLGNVIQLLYGWEYGAQTINVYYYQIPIGEVLTNIIQGSSEFGGQKNLGETPLGCMNLTFEPSLGDGDEFLGFDQISGNPLDDQRIIYPHYSGAGSQAYPMGSTQTFPNAKWEFMGAFPVNPSGPFTGGVDGSGVDADFADIIEDLFYGATQAGFGNDKPQTPIQHGLNCGQRPGTVQQANYSWSVAGFGPGGTPSFTYPLPNVAGDWLVVIASFGNSSAPLTISDAANNTWTPLFTGDNNIQVWYAQAKAYNVGEQGTTVTVTASWSGEPSAQMTLLEIAGVDTLDAVMAAAGTSASISTSGAQGTPMYILAFADYLQSYFPNGTIGGAVPPATVWQYVLDPDAPSGTVRQQGAGGNSAALYQLQSRIVQFPGTYNYTAPTVAGYPAAHVALLAFKCSQPPNYPPALGNVIGDIIDKPSLQIVRNQCRAAGLWGSLFLDAQTKGSEIIGQLYEAMDAWPVWSGFNLKSVPRSEVSAAGNGALYYAPTAPGPIADLVESDFNTQSDDPPVTITRKAQVNVPNILGVQHPNRASQYNDIVVTQPESGAVALYGPRKDSPKMMRMFQSPSVSRMYLSIQVRLANYVRNQFEFPLNAKWKLLEPGDLITIPVSSTMPNILGAGGSEPVPYVKIPLRILIIEEDEAFGLKVTAEPFIYGCYAPLGLPATAQQGYVPQTGGNPGSVNEPIIFEPVPRLAGGNTQPELWLVVSGGATTGSPPVTPNYGGCFVYVSTDGGNSYNPVAPLSNSGSVVGGDGNIPTNAIQGNAITGFLTEGWPASPSPDSINDLFIDLSESHGELESYSVQDEDEDTYPCYVGGGATSPLYVQSCSNAVGIGNGAAGGSTSKVFPNANNAGNVIFVIVAVRQGLPVGSIIVSDTKLNVYNLIPGCKTTGLNDGEAYVYAAANIAGGANTVEVSVGATSGPDVLDSAILFAAIEYSDVATLGSPPSAISCSFSVNQADQATPMPTGAFAVTIAGGLIIAFGFDVANTTDAWSLPAPVLGWNLRESPRATGSEGALAVWDTSAPNPSAQAVSINSDQVATFHVGALAVYPQNTQQVTGIPYELMTYAVAELTGPYQYTLKATSSGSPPEANHLDRGVFGAPAPNQGVLHSGPAFGGMAPYFGAARWAFVGPPYPGIMRIALDPSWIGKTLYFKFAAFNGFMGSVQSLSDCIAYPYTPTGTAGSASGNPASYTVAPTQAGSPPVAPLNALTNPTSTTIDMAQVTVQFPSNTVNYNARVFTIPNPTVPTTYYVTITDPGYTGDSPGQTNLAAICQTSNDLVGVNGNTYIGSIVAMPGGGGTVTSPGGSGGVDSFELLVNGA